MRLHRSNIQKVLYLALSLLLSLLMGALLFYLCGYDPVGAYREIIRGSLGSQSSLMTSIAQATPIIFTGLAFVVASKSGILNIGGEGQLYAGALAAALAGTYITELPSLLHIAVCLLAAVLTGGAWGALVAFLKVRFGAQEVITAIMLNYIMQSFTSYLVNDPLRATGSVGQTEMIQDSAKLPMISLQLSTGVLLAVGLSVLLWFVFRYTQTGFEMKVTGKNQEAAKVAGIRSERKLIQSMFISGAIAGLGGAVIILGSTYRFIDGFSSGYGFDGIAVAALSGQSFFGVLVSGLFFGALKTGAFAVNTFSKIPYDFAMVIQALVILFVATPRIPQYLSYGVCHWYKKIRRRDGV